MLLARIISVAVLAIFYSLFAPNRFVDAQTPWNGITGDCEEGAAEQFLDIGNVRAKILNTGGLFWNGGQNVYEVPRGGGAHSIFTAAFLMTGYVDGEIRTATTTFGPFEFWPGPIPENGDAPTDCWVYDRIYKVSASSGEDPGAVHALTGTIADWPADLGAPFVDLGGSPRTYDPEEGDYPELVGDQMLWWIMNDAGGEHKRSSSAPLGVEVRATAFAFDSAAGRAGDQTYYRYRIRNRSDRPIRAARVGLFQDVDLGAAFDDYVGSDSTNGTAYFYNADNDDDGNYGEAPPAIGFTVIKRPESTIDESSPECSYEDGRSTGLTNHQSYCGGSGRTCDPITAAHFHGYMSGRWKDGAPLVIGGHGYPTGEYADSPRTNFMFPGDPVTGKFWSEPNAHEDGQAMDPSDRRSISGVGPFCLGPGDETQVVFAIVWAHGTSNLDSVAQMRAIGAGVQQSASSILKPRRFEKPPEPELPVVPLAASIYPNPTTDTATLRLGLPQPMDVQVDIFDTLGRLVADVFDTRLDTGDRTWTLQAADWPPGVYLVRIQLDHLTETRRLIVAR